MRKLYFFLLLLTLSLFSLKAQPTINGDLSDSDYETVGIYSGSNDGFGSSNNLKNLKIFANTTDLYIGVGADLSSGNRVLLFLNFSGYDGRTAGINLGNFSGGVGNLPSVGNTNVRMGLEVDYALEFNRFESNLFVDANRWGTTGGIGGSFQGSCDLTGTPTTTGTLAGAEPWGTTTPNITFAFNNGGGANQGFEIRIPFSSIPGVDNSHTLSLFAIIANNDGTIFFSNECIPVASDGTGNFGTNPNITIGGTTPNALPVELTSFIASLLYNNIQLNWTTATEIDNYGFEVQRTKNSEQFSEESWETIAFIEGHGNSNSVKEYSFTDKNVNTGIYYYRLKQIDNDGSFKFSDHIEIEVAKPTEFALAQNFPNPFNPSTAVSYQLAVDSKVILTVFDILGNEIKTLVNEFQSAGNYNINFNAENLTSGIYFYTLQAGEFIETKKMVLMK